MAGFDADRALLSDSDIFQPFDVQHTHLLRDLVARGRVAGDAPVMVLEFGGKTLVLLAGQMTYHHVAQGEVDGDPWMVAFCGVCNTGSAYSPKVNGDPHHFAARGLYNGLALLGDRESRSYWDHITGECVHGSLTGYTLDIMPLLHMDAAQAMRVDHDAEIAVSDQSTIARTIGRLPELLRIACRGLPLLFGALTLPLFSERSLARQIRSSNFSQPPGIRRTMPNDEDDRRPRLEFGLGVWTPTTQRYYPLSDLREHGSSLIDAIEERGLLIYIDPASGVPAAIYTNATRAWWEDDILCLDTGEMLRKSILFRDGSRTQCDRPLQLFTRWYGFALTFPDCEIFPS